MANLKELLLQKSEGKSKSDLDILNVILEDMKVGLELGKEYSKKDFFNVGEELSLDITDVQDNLVPFIESIQDYTKYFVMKIDGKPVFADGKYSILKFKTNMVTAANKAINTMYGNFSDVINSKNQELPKIPSSVNKLYESIENLNTALTNLEKIESVTMNFDKLNNILTVPPDDVKEDAPNADKFDETINALSETICGYTTKVIEVTKIRIDNKNMSTEYNGYIDKIAEKLSIVNENLKKYFKH